MSILKYKRQPNKGVLHISFYNDKGEPVQEYIPNELTRVEFWLRDRYVKLLSRYNKGQYYWHYRYLFSHHTRKIEDIKFLKHYYERHLDDTNVDRIEKRHFNKIYRLYREEFSVLLMPKWVMEPKNKGLSHPYAIAYHKNWSRDLNPQFTRMYHGVDDYEMIDMITLMLNENKKENRKNNNTIRYQNKLAKKRNKLKDDGKH